MSRLAKGLRAASGGSAGGPVYVEDLFSTYVYTGGTAPRTINNGIDLSSDGGLVWLKSRNQSQEHILYDTERGANVSLSTNSTGGDVTQTGGVTSFNSNGFSLGNHSVGNGGGNDYYGWSFKKHEKFFDIVTWTGDGTASRVISHNINGGVGMIVIKNRDSQSNWPAIMKSGSTGATVRVLWNRNEIGNSPSTLDQGYITTITNSDFTVVSGTSNSLGVNALGDRYVAYIFGDNTQTADQIFGENGDEPAIKFGTYSGTGTAGTVSNTVRDIGFPADLILIKLVSDNTSGPWYIFDSARPAMQAGASNTDYPISIEISNNETYRQGAYLGLTSQGFMTTSTALESTGYNFIYMAIRRPMKTPTSASSVFAPKLYTTPGTETPAYLSGFETEFSMYRPRTGTSDQRAVLRDTNQRALKTNTTANETTDGAVEWYFMNGLSAAGSSDYISWNWKRATKFFDASHYYGDGTSVRSIPHNLEAVPEMAIVKRLNASGDWFVYHKDIGTGKYVRFANTGEETTNGTLVFPNSPPTSTHFNVGSLGEVNGTNNEFLIYLMASLSGISKVGSYVGNGSSQNIDCGFTNGARFVMLKRYDAATGAQPWIIIDSARGIQNAPSYTPQAYVNLNSTSDVTANFNTYSQGFGLATGNSDVNGNNMNYIFYAIA